MKYTEPFGSTERRNSKNLRVGKESLIETMNRKHSDRNSNHKDQRKGKYSNPIPTVDIILRRGNYSEILMERRARSPFKSFYALPGGHVEYGETVEQAAQRELEEEVSLKCKLKQILGVYSDPKRDPRGQRITAVFVADCVGDSTPSAGDDAKSAEWIDVKELLKPRVRIAFDHRLIIQDYRRWIRAEKEKATFWSSKNRSE